MPSVVNSFFELLQAGFHLCMGKAELGAAIFVLDVVKNLGNTDHQPGVA